MDGPLCSRPAVVLQSSCSVCLCPHPQHTPVPSRCWFQRIPFLFSDEQEMLDLHVTQWGNPEMGAFRRRTPPIGTMDPRCRLSGVPSFLFFSSSFFFLALLSFCLRRYYSVLRIFSSWLFCHPVSRPGSQGWIRRKPSLGSWMEGERCTDYSVQGRLDKSSNLSISSSSLSPPSLHDSDR